MSLVTRCPACATSFKVVRDQLRISDGWVRCGRCSEVFDASQDLRDTPDGSAAIEPPVPLGTSSDPAAVTDAAAPADSPIESRARLDAEAAPAVDGDGDGDADAHVISAAPSGSVSELEAEPEPEPEPAAETDAEFESEPEPASDVEVPTGFDRLDGFDEVDDFDAAEALDATRRSSASEVVPSLATVHAMAHPDRHSESPSDLPSDPHPDGFSGSIPDPIPDHPADLRADSQPDAQSDSQPEPSGDQGPRQSATDQLPAADGNFAATLRFPDHPQPPIDTLRYWPASDLLDLGQSIGLRAPSSPSALPSAPSTKPTTGLPAFPVIPPYGLIADEPWPTPGTREAALSGNRASAPTLTEATVLATHNASPAAPVINSQFDKALRRAREKAVKIARSRERRDDAAPDGEPASRTAPDETHWSTPTVTQSVPNDTATAVTESAVEAVPASEPTPLDTAPGAVPAAAPGTVPSFLEPDIPRRVRSHRIERPRVWIAAAAVAALVLIVQVVRQERDTMVARQPEIRPALSMLCRLTGCEIAAVRQIGAINIDGAAFTREKGADGYRLTFTLRNSVAMPLAMPAVELTLLDTQERAVVRRVILPAEFNAPPVLPANAERAASLALTLNLAEAAVLPPIAGYRVVAFYP